MGYYVRPLKRNDRPWAVMYRETEGGKRPARTLRDDELGTHGFHPGMNYEQARKRAADNNANAELKRLATRKMRISDQVRKESLALAVGLTDESGFIEWCRTEHRIKFDDANKHNSHWQCAKRVLQELGVNPTEYHSHRRRIYSWFAKEAYSVDYLEKVLRFLNLYGKHYARLTKTYVEAIPVPTGKDREEINDAFFDSDKKSKASLPLSPEALESSRASLSPEHYRWLYLSLWLGLRPLEVDALPDPKRTKMSREQNVTVLHVYQTKLKGVAREKRWKLIPLVEPEQKHIPEMLKEEFKRPLVKTIEARFGVGHNTYAGRKGFETLMRDRGWTFDTISAWLGHQSLDRTWKSYTDRTKVRLGKVG